MTAIMLNFEEARRNLALPMHGLLVNGGISPVTFRLSALFEFTKPLEKTTSTTLLLTIYRQNWHLCIEIQMGICQDPCQLCLACCQGAGAHACTRNYLARS